MFASTLIEKINNLNLVDVISKYVELKQQGTNFKGKSPFSDEKTGSFFVSPAKNIWKCFSSGHGGNNPVSFVMKLGGLSYVEAINELAGKFNLEIEYDNERGAEAVEKANRVREITEVNQLALEFWQNQLLLKNENVDGEIREDLPEDVKAQASRASMTQIGRFGLGFAPKSFDALKNHLLGKAVSLDMMVRARLVVHKVTEDETGTRAKNHDAFRNRIMFPVYDASGKLIGFSGRAVKEDKYNPKVFNSADSEAYRKSETLLGISLAKAEIIRTGFAIKVEGNFDVTSMHEKGLTNTVATLGSAFTQEQAQLIKKYTNKIVLAIDNDEAGLKKAEPDIKLCLSEGLNVIIWYSEIDGEDPDDFCKRHLDLKDKEFLQVFKALQHDAIEWLANRYFEGKESVQEKTAAQKNIADLLSIIPDALLRNNYVKELSAKFKFTKKDVEEQVTTELASRKSKELDKLGADGIKLPGNLSESALKDWNEFQFYADETSGKIGYYFMNQNNGFERVSNCIVKPIFQVESLTDSKRIVEIKNFSAGKFNTHLIELPNKAFVSQTDFETVLGNLPNFWFHGSKRNFQKLRVKLLGQFAYCREIRTLGWQPEGFFAFANGIIENSFKEVNQYGICIHGERNYFLPAFSKIYKDRQIEDDTYDQDRKFIYKDSKVTFAEWSKLFNEVYKESNNGMIAIAFLLAALFSDWIYGCNSNFPILFLFGQPSTGKTMCGRGISAVFKSDSTPFNLNQGTQVAITRRLAGSRNVVAHLDEYRNDLDEKKFQLLKAIFDRTGHEKGVLSRDNRTEVTKINAPAIIGGQHQSTRDGNSLTTRIILRSFDKTSDKFTQAEDDLFDKLQEMEKMGLSNIIVEVVKYRDLIQQEYERRQFEVSRAMKADLQKMGADIHGRVMDNHVVLCTMVDLLGDKLKLPFTYSEIYDECLDSVIRQSSIISDSDQLAEFFKMMEFLVLDFKLQQGRDYKIETITSLPVRISRNERKTLQFTDPIQVLHINFARIYPLYTQNMKTQKGEFGLPMTTIQSYMRTHKAFIGTPSVINFDGHRTNAYTFRMDQLPISLDITNKAHKTDDEPQSTPKNEHTQAITDAQLIDDELPF